MIKANSPTILVVFGATGDLMLKKIVPSLFFLHKNKQLPDKFKVVGFSRRKLSDTKFREHIFEILKTKEMVESLDYDVSGFLRFFHYQPGTFDNLSDYQDLGVKLEQIDDDWKMCSNKLFYFAVPSEAIHDIVDNLIKTGLSEPCGGLEGWSRFILEKPFGNNGKTAKKLEKLLENFKPEQVYRIDHYLGKEMVQGILNFRFSNNLLEHNWNNQHIEKIEMKLFEDIGIENRGGFYDSTGALRDVGQNHLLAILSLLTMDGPKNSDDLSFVEARGNILKKMRKHTKSEIAQSTYRAQYKGYSDIKDVKKNSRTETYFKIITELDHPKWSGIPITIESGKRMEYVQKNIIVTFKHPTPCLCNVNEHSQNRVIFSLHPEQGITIEFLAKKPGFESQIEKRTFDFLLYKEKTNVQYVEEYAKLLVDCMNGDRLWFCSKEEIEAMWNFIDPILEAWEENTVPLHSYEKNKTDMSQETAGMMKKYLESRNIGNTVGIIGLGRMGGNLARKLKENNWDVVGYDRTEDVTKKIESEAGIRGAYTLEEFMNKLNQEQRIIFLSLPAGEVTNGMIFGKDGLSKHLRTGDIIIDGGNSFYKDTVANHEKLKERGVEYIDCGVSGGPGGARNGACLMIGGSEKVFKLIEPLFRDMSRDDGYRFFPGSGAGHFVKMVHNGIEYGMMQAIGEGFEILKKADYKLDLNKVAEIYNNGSVIESRLVGWLNDAFTQYGTDLDAISGRVEHSGEGKWTAKTAKELKVPAKIIAESVKFRIESHKNPSYTGQVVSALRGQFGQHAVIKKSFGAAQSKTVSKQKSKKKSKK